MSSAVDRPKIDLPGYSALREADHGQIHPNKTAYELADKVRTGGRFKLQEAYLAEPYYNQYMQIHKVLVGQAGAYRLLAIADKLSSYDLPEYLSSAGSAYLEAALALKDESAAGRMELVSLAESSWQKSLAVGDGLLNDPLTEALISDSDQYRTALNLAFLPITKSIVVGDVNKTARSNVFADTLAIAQSSSAQMLLARKAGREDVVSDYVGLLHECNTLLTLLHIDDPRYAPVPSFQRAGNGQYNREQTHDISIINQHWGVIKKIIPVEVKSRVSKHDVARYKALLVRGRMHLIASNSRNPVETLDSFGRLYEGAASDDDIRKVDYATDNLLDLLRLYQRGNSKRQLATSSPTRFHDAKYVSHRYKGMYTAATSSGTK